MGFYRGPNIVKTGLVLCLDAASRRSYPTTGTTWYDLSGNGNHMTLNAAGTWVNSGSTSHMNFDSGIAKYLPGGTLTTIPGTTNGTGTICIYSTIKSVDVNWKTLVRGTPADPDHQVIISTNDTVSLGMYDNDGAGFIDSGFDVTSFPNRFTQFNFMAWRLSNTSPYYEFFYNENLTSPQGTLTAPSSIFDSGFCCIGGYHNNSSVATDFDQNWGKISVFLYYNRILTTSELQQNYNALKKRFGV